LIRAHEPRTDDAHAVDDVEIADESAEQDREPLRAGGAVINGT
jgi:hypothetical protein